MNHQKKKEQTQLFSLRRATILLIVFLLAATLLFLDANTHLYINNIVVHFVIFFLAFALFPIMISAYFLNLKSTNTVLMILFSALCICFLIAFLTWNGGWKTQTILYKNRNNPSQTIEYQMRGDRLSFGYKKQIIQRGKILPYLDFVTEVDTAKLNPLEWRRVDLVVNEMKIPGEYVNSLCP